MKTNITNNSINITNIKDEFKNLENKTENGFGDNDIKMENKSEIRIGIGDINDYYIINKINRCRTCFNKLKEKNYI